MQRKREKCKQTKKTITKEASITGTRRKISASKNKVQTWRGSFPYNGPTQSQDFSREHVKAYPS